MHKGNKKMLVPVLSVILFLACCALIGAMTLAMGTEEKTVEALDKHDLNAMPGYDDYISKLSAGVMDDVPLIPKVYVLAEDVVVAPEPDQSLFGASLDPADAAEVLENAAGLLGDEELLWLSDKDRLEGSYVRWYLDETIFIINWKEVINYVTYTFTEVKVAHPSQFRRYFVDDSFAAPKQYFPSKLAATVNAVAAMNGDYYKFRKVGIVVYKSELYRSDGEELDTCFVDRKGDMHFVERGTFTEEEEIRRYIDENDIQFSLAFGPTLIEDGELVVPDWYIIGEVNDKYSRSAICQLGELHYLLVAANAEGRGPAVTTLKGFANALYDKGVRNAYTLDGGQTGTIIVNDKVINSVTRKYERPVSDIIFFATAIPEKEES